ncbi:hypothetical protein ACFX2F_002150 [Malus domestica]
MSLSKQSEIEQIAGDNSNVEELKDEIETLKTHDIGAKRISKPEDLTTDVFESATEKKSTINPHIDERPFGQQ